MRPEVQQQLLELNRRFYATVAEEFDRTRQGLPEGMRRLTQRLQERLSSPMRVLDVGCGNGRFARALAEAGVTGTYVGLDADERLLALAIEQTRELSGLSCHFARVDLAQPGWTAATEAPYDAVVALAVLHHFPGYALRQRLVREMARLVAPHGLLALSTWQFLSAPRFLERTLPWSEFGLNEADVEPGDALLPWNQGIHAVRYVHHLDLTEVEALITACGLHVIEHFRADGKEGNLNLFVVAQGGGES